MVGLATTFGSGAMTNSLKHLRDAKLIFLTGSNITEAHPVLAAFVKQAVRKGCRLIVVDPRRTGIVKHAETHLQIKVGSDIALLNGLMHVLIKENLYDAPFVEAHTENFDALKTSVQDYTPEYASSICGISPEVIVDVARTIASVKPAMLAYTLGITEHTCGVHNVYACASLQMLLGNMGQALGGLNPLRGQNNVQGSCDMGALPDVFPGQQKVLDDAVREKFAKFWGVDNLSIEDGLMIPDMIEGLKTKKIKAFYIFGENIANTEPDIKHVESCLAAADFLVVQDIFHTETTRFAHVILPAAAWSENDGTFTNSERRVNRVRTASKAPGDAKPNWWIFKKLAEKLGHNWVSNSAQELWDNEISELSPILAGIKYHRLEGDGLQWPCPSQEHVGTEYLHKDGNFVRGKGLFMPVKWTPSAEMPCEDYPFVLSTGRRLYHYHTRTQTGRCEGLNTLLSHETADISPVDAQNLGIEQGEVIRVSSRRGAVDVVAKITEDVPQGLVWMAFHFRENNANWITNAAFDPISKTAEYKACAVQIQKI